MDNVSSSRSLKKGGPLLREFVIEGLGEKPSWWLLVQVSPTSVSHPHVTNFGAATRERSLANMLVSLEIPRICNKKRRIGMP